MAFCSLKHLAILYYELTLWWPMGSWLKIFLSREGVPVYQRCQQPGVTSFLDRGCSWVRGHCQLEPQILKEQTFDYRSLERRWLLLWSSFFSTTVLWVFVIGGGGGGGAFAVRQIFPSMPFHWECDLFRCPGFVGRGGGSSGLASPLCVDPGLLSLPFPCPWSFIPNTNSWSIVATKTWYSRS